MPSKQKKRPFRTPGNSKQPGKDDLWQRPLLASIILTAALSLIAIMVLMAVGLKSFGSFLFLCFVIFGIILLWYWGISLFLLDKELDRATARRGDRHIGTAVAKLPDKPDKDREGE